MCVNIFAKAVKVLAKSKQVGSAGKESLVIEGARISRVLAAAVDSDKTMSNLKGKAKEIAAIC